MTTPITYQQAFEYHQAGDLETAEKLYKKALSHQPENAAILHLLSILYGQQSRLNDAHHYITEALRIEPTSATFYNTLGNIERHLGHLSKAVSAYQKVLKLAPESAATYNNLGILYYQTAQFDTAITYYRKAIQLKPDYVDAYYNLSNTLTQKGEFEAAIQTLQTALRYQPDHPQIHTHLGQLLLRTKHYREAIEHSEARLKIEPEHIETHHQLAVALTHEHRYEEAISHYLEVVKNKPDHTEALHNLGALYLMRRESDLALTCYLRLLAVEPDIDTYYNLGVIYFYQDRHDDAINYFLEVLRLAPHHFNTHLNLGAAYIKKENLQKAADHYEAALSQKPDDPELLYILAAITGKSAPTEVPAAYIEHLFDEYAPHFDQHLKKYLDYHVPEILLKAITQISTNKQADWQILDLGCGTGLCGEKVKPFAKQLIGIDVSEKMLAVAQTKNIYDRLEKIDIYEALARYPSQDLILAGDVLGYVGDLEKLFVCVKQALNKEGHFAFTIERTTEAPFILQRNARFAHSKAYIEYLAEKHNFQIECLENAILRMQKAEKVEGYVVVLSI